MDVPNVNQRRRTSLFDPPRPLIYFEVNIGVSYFLDYVEDIYIMMVLSVLISILDPNPMYLPHPAFTKKCSTYCEVRV